MPKGKLSRATIGALLILIAFRPSASSQADQIALSCNGAYVDMPRNFSFELFVDFVRRLAGTSETRLFSAKITNGSINWENDEGVACSLSRITGNLMCTGNNIMLTGNCNPTAPRF
jgi:hypothetical protein